jgi:hypothetical protein
MKQLLIGLLIIGAVACIPRTDAAKPYIDLPEEIPIAKIGDTLEVYKKSGDTIYIRFANQRNK